VNLIKTHMYICSSKIVTMLSTSNTVGQELTASAKGDVNNKTSVYRENSMRQCMCEVHSFDIIL